MHSVLDTLSDSTGSTAANDLDLIFLKGIMESPVVSVTTLTPTGLEHSSVISFQGKISNLSVILGLWVGVV